FLCWLHSFARQGSVQSSRKIVPQPQAQVANLSGPGIDFDDVRVSGARLQHAIVLVASCPATNACAFTTDRRRSIDGKTNVLSWSRSARLAARAKSGGACNVRKVSSASPSVWTILTPSPPEVPFAFRTVGNPIRVTHVFRSSMFRITSAFGARTPSA